MTGADSLIIQQSTDGGETWTDSTIITVFDGPEQNFTPGDTTITETSTAARINGLTTGTTYDFKLVASDNDDEVESNSVSTTY